MHRARGIDFAAIEASAEAYEAIDNFAASRYSPSVQSGSCHTGRYHMNKVESYEDIEVVNGEEVDISYNEYLDTLPVYRNNKIGVLKEGVSFTVTGHILLNCERFSINFIIDNEYRDVPLHINPRLPQSYIVRNTKVKNVWGSEEISSALPFLLRRGSKFSIQIFITEECYMISVNGYHFAKYRHRLPYKLVSAVEVKGDVESILVERAEVAFYPDRLPESQTKNIRVSLDEVPKNKDDYDEVDGTHIPQEWRIIPMPKNIKPETTHDHGGLSLPYYGRLPPKSLIEGRCLKVEGRVKLLPHSFYINLQQGEHIWPHPVIAFHFNPRFSKQSGAIGKAIVCRNAWYDGEWADEERSELDTDFRPGKTFSMVIVCCKSSFAVFVNHKFITEFRYHIKPNIVDTVYIQGDIKLWDVALETNIAPDGRRRIYNNPLYSETDDD